MQRFGRGKEMTASNPVGAAVLGFITGEWKGAARKIIGLLLVGLVVLILGIVIVVNVGTV
jgi:hypothetical protein